MHNTTNDIVFIRNLTLNGILGILPAERTTPQPIVFNVSLYCDTNKAARSADISDAIDYAMIAAQIESHLMEHEYLLVETLAENVANLLLKDQRIAAVDIEVGKPSALAHAESVGVRIHRQR